MFQKIEFESVLLQLFPLIVIRLRQPTFTNRVDNSIFLMSLPWLIPGFDTGTLKAKPEPLKVLFIR